MTKAGRRTRTLAVAVAGAVLAGTLLSPVAAGVSFTREERKFIRTTARKIANKRQKNTIKWLQPQIDANKAAIANTFTKAETDARIDTQRFAVVPSGTTIAGAVGGDFDAHNNLLDWGVIVSLPAPAASPLSDAEVAIDVSGWVSGDVGQVQPTTSDTDPGCTGTPAEPTAPTGKVCVYVAGGDNAQDVNGYSVLPGTGASPFGFKLAWTNTGPGDTFIDAVWAYTAP